MDTEEKKEAVRETMRQFEALLSSTVFLPEPSHQEDLNEWGDLVAEDTGIRRVRSGSGSPDVRIYEG